MYLQVIEMTLQTLGYLIFMAVNAFLLFRGGGLVYREMNSLSKLPSGSVGLRLFKISMAAIVIIAILAETLCVFVLSAFTIVNVSETYFTNPYLAVVAVSSFTYVMMFGNLGARRQFLATHSFDRT
jgi:hypothetical protein